MSNTPEAFLIRCALFPLILPAAVVVFAIFGAILGVGAAVAIVLKG